MLQNLLNELYEKELDRLDAKRDEIVEILYPIVLPDTIKCVSELTDIPDELLVQSCVGAAWHYKDLEWHSVLDIVKSFYLAKRNIEEREKQS